MRAHAAGERESSSPARYAGYQQELARYEQGDYAPPTPSAKPAGRETATEREARLTTDQTRHSIWVYAGPGSYERESSRWNATRNRMWRLQGAQNQAHRAAEAQRIAKSVRGARNNRTFTDLRDGKVVEMRVPARDGTESHVVIVPSERTERGTKLEAYTAESLGRTGRFAYYPGQTVRLDDGQLADFARTATHVATYNSLADAVRSVRATDTGRSARLAQLQDERERTAGYVSASRAWLATHTGDPWRSNETARHQAYLARYETDLARIDRQIARLSAPPKSASVSRKKSTPAA